MIIVFLRFLYLIGFSHIALTSITAITCLSLAVNAKANEPGKNEVILGSPTDETDPGNDRDGGCPCVDVSGLLASIPSRSCQLSNGEIGTKLSADVGCVPLSFGSSNCEQHDLFSDPSCFLNITTKALIPTYCVRPWCYVNSKSCMKDSYERIYRSSYFSFNSGIDLFYSYTKCNSTADDWLATGKSYDEGKMKKITIRANVPEYVIPLIYKNDPLKGEALAAIGDEYYDNSIPYKGIYIDYVDKITQISTDIQNISYTYRSKASSLVQPNSNFTAAVQDIMDGLVDMSVGPFWITAERLKMASFTIPIIYDKTFLVIKRPGNKKGFGYQVSKVIAPFSPGVWCLLILITLFTALLSVWFSSHTGEARNQSFQEMSWRRTNLYARLALDSFLQKGSYFFSAGVDHDADVSLPNKCLMFGFGFFILIAVSAYVANLAAFLTKNFTEVNSVDSVVAAGLTICAHPAIQHELKMAWPKANFYFIDGSKGFNAMTDDYDLGHCKVLAVGLEDTSMDLALMKKFCERDLVFTRSLFVDIPIAFPASPELASDISYWMFEGERFHDITFANEKNKYSEEHGKGCDVQLSEEEDDSSDKLPKITVVMMIFPLIFFLGFALLAVILQLIHQARTKSRRKTLPGAVSITQVSRVCEESIIMHKKKKNNAACLEEEYKKFYR